MSADVATPSPRALDQAHLLALKALLGAHPASALQVDYAWALPEVEARLHLVVLPATAIQPPPAPMASTS